MANKIKTSSKNIKPRINLNHNIDILEAVFTCDRVGEQSLKIGVIRQV